MEERFKAETGVLPQLSPLTVDIEDDRLLRYLKGLESSAKKHWDSSEINLTARRKQNLKYLFGRQLIGQDLKEYESEFLDNVIGESEKILKALATSKMPDYVIKPGGVGNSPERKETAELLTKVIADIIDSDKNKFDLGMMFKHLPAYLIAAKKYRWDATKNGIGDYEEEVINPDHLLLDHTALSSNPDEMQFIIHYVEKTAKEWVMLFPDKEEEIKNYIKSKFPSTPDDKEDWLLAQKVRVAEAWYDWIDKAEDFDPKENPKFNFMSGVAWMLSKDVLLGKTKNPNWDYEGHDVAMLDGQPIDPMMMEQITQQMILTGQQPAGFEYKKVFNNYFKFPRKPFIFMTFDQFLRSAIDETSRIEQQIPLQKSMDKVERQVDHMVANHKGKHIWGSDSGVTKKELKKMDMNNPNVDAVVKGNPKDVHDYIQPEMPPGEMFGHVVNRRDRMFAKVGADAVRGELQSDTATTNQIARESNFTLNDDLVNGTILPVSTESIKARFHMMKLRYTEEHFKQLAGIEEGKYLHLRLTNDSLDDGMEITVAASTVDKLRAERNAQALASMQMIDPYNLMKDMGIPDPEGRAEALYLFNTNPDLWYQKVVLKKSMEEIAQTAMQAAPAPIPPTVPVEGQVVQGAPAAAPMQPSPTDTSNIATEPQGSPGIMSQVGSALKGALGKVVSIN